MREIQLFKPLTIKDVTFRNRIGVSPMCQYSAVDGEMNDWHLVHLGSRAVGGAGLVLLEATAVAPEGRISPQDSGLWNDVQEQKLKPIVDFIKGAGSVAGIQIGHAGRKASTDLPWEGGGPLQSGAWPVVGPSPIAFSPKHQVPHELTEQELDGVVADFVAAAQRARNAGFEVLEAEIPGCEIFNLIIDVKSLTEGLGSFEHEFEQMKTVQNKQLSDSLIKEFSSKETEICL